MRIYVDTSVVGGYFDREFSEATAKFFERVESGDLILVVSDLLETELERAPSLIRNHLATLPQKQIEIVQLSREAISLANEYIAEHVVGATSTVDCQHIAIATIARVDVLVSWNFKHIVNLKRIRGYNGVNLKNNYQMLEIRTPEEVLEI